MKVLAGLLSVLPLWAMADDVSTCDDGWNTFCERESNRFCYINEEDGKEKCGNCLPTFVEWRARCISEEKVDILLFLEEYAPDYVENLSDEERASLLLKAIEFIADYNAQNPPPSFELGLNAFSADSDLDIKGRLGFDPTTTPDGVTDRIRQPQPNLQNPGTGLPEKVDWVEQGAVTSVKDQGRCGCCWAVATTGVIEGAVAIQHNFLQSLSHQQFISCDKQNHGCNGGNMVYSLTYSIRDTDGIARLNDYDYSDYGGTTTKQCDSSAPAAVEVSWAEYVVDYYDDYTFEERLQRMKTAISMQPVAIAIKSACPLFTNYKRGILTEDIGCTCNGPLCADHAVLLVGYDDTSDPPSWTIKNSWGTGWGEDGYVRIAQTEKGDFGLFGVLLHGVAPTLTANLTDGSTRVAEPTSWDDDDDVLEWWAWFLVLAAVLFVAFCLVSVICGALFPRKKG